MAKSHGEAAAPLPWPRVPGPCCAGPFPPQRLGPAPRGDADSMGEKSLEIVGSSNIDSWIVNLWLIYG